MAVGKNKQVVSKKKGGKKKTTDLFAKKDWFEVKAPQMFGIRQIGKTVVTRSAGTRDCKDSLRGRVFTLSLGDLKDKAEDEAFRKFSLKVEEVHGSNCLTNFSGMSLSRDKLCSLIRKWQTMIEVHTDVKTADGYLLRVFAIGFTKKRANQLRKTSYAQSAQVRAIRKKMVEIIQKEAGNIELKDVVTKLITDTIGKDIEKACQNIYPLQNVFIRQVKTLRSPKLDVQKLFDLHGGAAGLAEYGNTVERVATAEDTKEDAADADDA